MRTEILSKNYQTEFDRPPKFNLVERKLVFEIPDSLRNYVRSLESTVSIVCFTLQYGYFKTSGRFFYINKFYPDDIDAICRWNEIDKNRIDWSNYHKSLIYRQQKMILKHFGITSFGKKQKSLLEKEAARMLKKQKRPQAVFWILAEYLRNHRIEIPTYNTLSSIILESVKKVNNEYMQLIDTLLTPSISKLLDNLLSKEQESFTYNITQLKHTNETIKLRDIRENIADYKKFKHLYHQIATITQRLDLSLEMIEYYAHFVIKARVFQISRRENKYLILICFIIYQYYSLGDLLIETLLSATKEVENLVQRKIKTSILETQNSTETDLKTVLEMSRKMAIQVGDLIEVRDNGEMNERQRLEYYQDFVKKEFLNEFVQILDPIKRIRKKTFSKEPLYYEILEEQSRKLQYKTAEILRTIDFEVPNQGLESAIIELKNKEENIVLNTDFLTPEEKKNLKNAKSKQSLYKALLTKHTTQGIKAGDISLVYSFQNQPFENYLIDSQYWEEQKDFILEDANLQDKNKWDSVKTKLKESLQNAYDKAYESIDSSENPYVGRRRKNNKPHFTNPVREKISLEDTQFLFPQEESSVPILEILSTMNQSAHFTHAFKHWSDKSIPKRPSDMEFFAVLIAYGCNVGLNNIAKSTTNVNRANLTHTSNWYFSLENIQKANDIIVDFTDRLKLVNLLQNEQQKVHTSSDGQKFYVKADSIHANYAFKYFGKDKGIVMYSFIDNLHRLFYATAISASEREAPYVLDGVMHNEVVETELHSTDTHGYTELVFAITYLLDIEFAPRIANFQDHILFTFEGIAIPDLENYELNVKEINTKNIEQQWENLLKIAATIKLKHTPASTLFKRLNSYARQNSIYLALRDLGRLVRSKFLLEYMYDHHLRQMIQQQLNKGESSNQLARHIFYGNNGQIKYASKQEHLQVTACKTLIHNLIICWNYMYLSKQVFKAKPENRQEIFQKIKQISPVRWEHINFYGVFDFSDEALKNALAFDPEELFNFEIE
jgi:TnpA family transposase